MGVILVRATIIIVVETLAELIVETTVFAKMATTQTHLIAAVFHAPGAGRIVPWELHRISHIKITLIEARSTKLLILKTPFYLVPA